MPKQTDKNLGLFFKKARNEQKLTYEELAVQQIFEGNRKRRADTKFSKDPQACTRLKCIS